MYLIIDRKTKAILHMCNSHPGEDKKAEDLFPAFDSAKMEFGRAPDQYIPEHFTIEKGVVKDVSPCLEAPAETLAQARERKLREFSDLSQMQRRELIPDYQLMNAGLGLYEEERTRAYQGTVQAFRDEYHRLEALVAKAKTKKDLDAIKAAFPKAVVAIKKK